MNVTSLEPDVLNYIAHNLNNNNFDNDSKSKKKQEIATGFSTANSATHFVQTAANSDQSKWSLFKQECSSFCCVFIYLAFKSQKFYSVKVYLLLLCLITLFSSMIQGGYISAIITSLQAQFNISLTIIAYILSSFDIMSLFSLPIVSYLGSKFSKPKIISICSILFSIGAVLFTLPFFIDSHYSAQFSSTYFNQTFCQSANSSSLNNQSCLSNKSSKNWAITIFVIAQLIMSWGIAPHFSLGITFITDNTEEQYHAMYTGIIYGAVAFGPALGYLLGSYFLSMWLYLNESAPTNISQTDSNWVGAWYLGFLVAAGCVTIISCILITFPGKIERTKLAKNQEKKLKKKKTKTEIAENDNNSSVSSPSDPPSLLDYGKGNGTMRSSKLPTIKELPEVQTQIEFAPPMQPSDSVSAAFSANQVSQDTKMKGFSWCFFLNYIVIKMRILGFLSSFPRLLRNFRFTLLVFVTSIESILVSVFTHYMVLYAQTVYQLSSSTSSILIGAVVIPAAIFGAILGGLIVKKFSLEVIGSARLILGSSTVVLAGILITTLIRCETTTSIGIDVNLKKYSANICDRNCTKCGFNYVPVCDSATGVSYVSPCYAGCSNLSSIANNVFINCSCPNSGQVNNGKCSPDCTTNLIIFMIILFILVTAESICLTPITLLLLRLIDKQLHPFGLGVMRMLNVLIANIPTPLLLSFGLNQTCLLWDTDSCTGAVNKDGKCLEYNANSFHYVLFGSLLGVKSFAWLLMLWFTVHVHRSYIFRSIYTNSINLNHDPNAPKATQPATKHNRQISHVPFSVGSSLKIKKNKIKFLNQLKQNEHEPQKQNNGQDNDIVLISHNRLSSV